jgi:hypothetical protein
MLTHDDFNLLSFKNLNKQQTRYIIFTCKYFRKNTGSISLI